MRAWWTLPSNQFLEVNDAVQEVSEQELPELGAEAGGMGFRRSFDGNWLANFRAVELWWRCCFRKQRCQGQPTDSLSLRGLVVTPNSDLTYFSSEEFLSLASELYVYIYICNLSTMVKLHHIWQNRYATRLSTPQETKPSDICSITHTSKSRLLVEEWRVKSESTLEWVKKRDKRISVSIIR